MQTPHSTKRPRNPTAIAEGAVSTRQFGASGTYGATISVVVVGNGAGVVAGAGSSAVACVGTGVAVGAGVAVGTGVAVGDGTAAAGDEVAGADD